jgi:hypothetical protein
MSRGRADRGSKRRIQVSDQVHGILNTDREAEQIIRYRRGRPLTAAPVLDQAL